MTSPLLYFAYGSNLSRVQMAARCPDASVMMPGVLGGYRLAFSGKTTKWGEGGVATILAAAEGDVPEGGVAGDGAQEGGASEGRVLEGGVPGLLYRMTPADVEALDRFEAVPRVYRRLEVEVAGEDGRSYPALTYQQIGSYPNPPPMGYFLQIWRAYKEFALEERALVAAVAHSLNHGA